MPLSSSPLHAHVESHSLISPSVRTLAKTAFPLVLSALSANAMVFADRLILGRYDLNAMSAAAAAGTAAWMFILAVITIASITEVFVGKHNGAGEYDKMAAPVWQMIYFAFLLPLVFIPIIIWGAPHLIPAQLHEHGLPFFRIILATGVPIALSSALTGFFAGKGTTSIVAVAAISANILNIILDFVFIFGFSTIIPPLGAAGAALATFVAQLIQTAILFAVFVSKENRALYKTHRPTWDGALFKTGIALATPTAIGHIIEIGSHASLFHLAAAAGNDYVTALTLGQSLYVLFAFTNEGLEKAVTAITANLIGAGKRFLVRKLLRSAAILHVSSVAVLFVLIQGCSRIVPLLFESGDHHISPTITPHLGTIFFFVWLYIVLDGLAWIFAGALTALGRTKTVMVSTAIWAWCADVVPTALVLSAYQTPPSIMWVFACCYGLTHLITLAIVTYRDISGEEKKERTPIILTAQRERSIHEPHE